MASFYTVDSSYCCRHDGTVAAMMALLPPFPLLSSRVERHDIDDETLIR
jgi:hypothetical protein